jgi:hypothetical protein
VGSPACADDVALLAGNHQELQTQLLVAENFASKDRYKINPTKSDLLIFNSRYTTDQWNDSIQTSIFSQPIKVVENTVHLGVLRYAKPHDYSSDAYVKVEQHAISSWAPEVTVQTVLSQPSRCISRIPSSYQGCSSAWKPYPSLPKITRILVHTK